LILLLPACPISSPSFSGFSWLLGALLFALIGLVGVRAALRSLP
jgi:hypothetical protein